MELFLFICVGILSLVMLLIIFENANAVSQLEKERNDLKKENGLLREINSVLLNQDFDYLDFTEGEEDDL